jgi:N-dimethylarginine dimethylaminohydrolase
MDTSTPVDGERAVARWQDLHDTYRRLGHRRPRRARFNLPDMVYAANARA